MTRAQGEQPIGHRHCKTTGEWCVVGSDGYSYTPEDYAAHLEDQAIDRAREKYEQ